jgi:signal transduction histidine kinase
MSAHAAHDAVPSQIFVARVRAGLDALDHLGGGLGTAVFGMLTVLVLLVTAALSLVGIGLGLAPNALRMLRLAADRERTRLSRWGPEVFRAEPVPARLRDALRDVAVRRELGWVAVHATMGLFLSAVTMVLSLSSIHDISFPFWWRIAPEKIQAPSLALWSIHDWRGAGVVCLAGLAVAAFAMAVMPGMAWLQAWPGRRLLSPPRGTDLALRVAELTATRAAALDAHTTELRRIERSLHDGTQNRLVAVNVLLGTAMRAVARDPAGTMEILRRAQDANEQALAELRGVVRSILPPVLAERSLPDALTALAAACPVACYVEAHLPERYAMSVEATVYFVVAEGLTNVARHSGAGHATVRLYLRDNQLCAEIADDGRGGADPDGGSGLSGIRRRVEAHDGTFTLSSPVGGPTVMTVSLPCGS